MLFQKKRISILPYAVSTKRTPDDKQKCKYLVEMICLWLKRLAGLFINRKASR